MSARPIRKPISQSAAREQSREVKRLEAELRRMRESMGRLRDSYLAADYQWIAALFNVDATTVSSVRTAKRLGFAVGVRCHNSENRLDFYAIPTRTSDNVE